VEFRQTKYLRQPSSSVERKLHEMERNIRGF